MATPAFVFTQEEGGDAVLEVKVFASSEPGGGVRFTFDTTVEDGYRVDLNGFFLDIGGDGGPLFRAGTNNGNNMNGGNNDGYDYAVELGTVGGNDTDFTDGYVVIPGISLADLEGSDAGLRATSFGMDGEGSLKLVDDYDPPPPPPGDDFPLWPQDISNVVLYFDTTDGDANDDGYYTVKIDDWPEAGDDDLDASIADILAWLEVNDPVFQGTPDAEELLLGAAIKGGIQETQFFAYGDNNANGTAPDDLPAGLTELVENNAIDVSYAYTDVLGLG